MVSGTLALFLVPAPSANSSFEASGSLKSVSRPLAPHDDMGIVLECGRSYYVNRAIQVEHFAWQDLLKDAKPGDQIHLTVAVPLVWRMLGHKNTTLLPVVGIQTEERLYMDPSVSAERWSAQAAFGRVAAVSFLTLLVCMLPYPAIRRR
jgi:hypothetical protein